MSHPQTEPAHGEPLTKAQWRRAIVSVIAGLDPDDRGRQEAWLAEVFPHLPGWAEAETILLYASAFSDELRTEPLLTIAYESGKQVLLPRVDRREHRLRLHRVIDPASELRPGVLGIPEPSPDCPQAAADSVDWALVPGLVFDERGYRVGRGAGHYDRLLPAMRNDAVCWSLCLSCQLVPRVPIEPHDIPLDGVTAPDRTVLGARSALTAR